MAKDFLDKVSALAERTVKSAVRYATVTDSSRVGAYGELDLDTLKRMFDEFVEHSGEAYALGFRNGGGYTLTLSYYDDDANLKSITDVVVDIMGREWVTDYKDFESELNDYIVTTYALDEGDFKAQVVELFEQWLRRYRNLDADESEWRDMIRSFVDDNVVSDYNLIVEGVLKDMNINKGNYDIRKDGISHVKNSSRKVRDGKRSTGR